ncbi:serine/arginine repetitive matrix protein 1 [Ophiocordyceps camponoti-floridani]|uniref:Serine/arginine repetitive matrix protein 1 n=1 Tax=Ophiocordyceps camponoti-floridani TaxID=2030778 RepID=A0A8H4Q6G7_9HYPO|nr:serine/arginine repetitive matrix protein 1 [Ophiocordyceps camponoti-floridani]
MDRDRDGRGRRYDDGEIIRYGAGESWRPTPRGGDRGGDRSPRRTATFRAGIKAADDPVAAVIGTEEIAPVIETALGDENGRGLRYAVAALPERPDTTASDPLVEIGTTIETKSATEIGIVFAIETIDAMTDAGHAPHTAGTVARGHLPPPDRSQLLAAAHIGPCLDPRAEEGTDTISRSEASEKTSPRPGSTKLRSPEDPAHPAAGSVSASAKEASRSGPNDSTATPARSPPCGPAALRASGPGVSSGRNAAASAPSPALSSGRHPQTPGATAASHRSDATSPTNPPSGPRGYVPPSKGGFSLRQGRGGWNHAPSRQISGPSPSSTPGGPSTIPTGPRSVPANSSFQSSSSQQRSFNPPSGPSSQHGGGQRQTLAQSLLANMPALVPGGKLDLSMTPMALGVTRELEPHYRKLRDEEEKLRDELRSKQERLRRSLYIWDKLERDSRAWELRSDLSEKSMKNLAGEGMGGAAF